MPARSMLVFAISVLAVVTMACRPKYAVLVSAHRVIQDDQADDAEWWYDLVEQYKVLRELGFRDEHIFVLYGRGHDFLSNHPAFDAKGLFHHTITREQPSRLALAEVFANINNRMTRPGYLYVWWMSHGDPVEGSSDPCRMTLRLE